MFATTLRIEDVLGRADDAQLIRIAWAVKMTLELT